MSHRSGIPSRSGLGPVSLTATIKKARRLRQMGAWSRAVRICSMIFQHLVSRFLLFLPPILAGAGTLLLGRSRKGRLSLVHICGTYNRLDRQPNIEF